MRPSIVALVGISLVPLLLHDVHAAQVPPTAAELVNQLARMVPLLNAGSLAERASQVMTLNLTNLLILALGKGILALLMLATSPTGLGTMFLKRSGEFRTDDDGPKFGIDGTEIQWGTQYLLSDASGDWTCMKRLFCEEPHRAETYLNVGRMLVTAARWTANLGLFSFTTRRHQRLIKDLDEAIQYGNLNVSVAGECRQKYKCQMSSY